MATVRPGSQPVLLVVDVQVGVMNEAWDMAMTWLSYPGRRNGTAKAEAFDFAEPGGLR